MPPSVPSVLAGNSAANYPLPSTPHSTNTTNFPHPNAAAIDPSRRPAPTSTTAHGSITIGLGAPESPDDAPADATPVKRKRGRPPGSTNKFANPSPSTAAGASAPNTPGQSDDGGPPKKKRGRPPGSEKKYLTPGTPSTPAASGESPAIKKKPGRPPGSVAFREPLTAAAYEGMEPGPALPNLNGEATMNDLAGITSDAPTSNGAIHASVADILALQAQSEAQAPPTPPSKKRGRPLGSTNKPKSDVETTPAPVAPKKMGRPLGSVSKTWKGVPREEKEKEKEKGKGKGKAKEVVEAPKESGQTPEAGPSRQSITGGVNGWAGDHTGPVKAYAMPAVLLPLADVREEQEVVVPVGTGTTLYTNARTGLCLDDPNGDVVIQSQDGYAWRIRVQVLQAASYYFTDFIADPFAEKIVIPFAYTAQDTHAFLHFITRHHLELESTHLPLHSTMTTQLARILPILEAYICVLHHPLAEQQAVLIHYAGGHPLPIYKLAVKQGWGKVVKLAVGGFWKCSVAGGQSMDPENWPLELVEEIGAKSYRAMVIATSAAKNGAKLLGRGVGARDAWEKVAELLQ